MIKEAAGRRGQAHAALVMIGDEAIAWAEYGTPDELPNICHRKQYLAEADVMPDYRITCIFVDKRYRRQSYANVAIAARNGPGRIEVELDDRVNTEVDCPLPGIGPATTFDRGFPR